MQKKCREMFLHENRQSQKRMQVQPNVDENSL